MLKEKKTTHPKQINKQKTEKKTHMLFSKSALHSSQNKAPTAAQVPLQVTRPVIIQRCQTCLKLTPSLTPPADIVIASVISFKRFLKGTLGHREGKPLTAGPQRPWLESPQPDPEVLTGWLLRLNTSFVHAPAAPLRREDVTGVGGG